MVRALNPPAEPNEGYWAQLLLFQDMRCRCVGVCGGGALSLQILAGGQRGGVSTTREKPRLASGNDPIHGAGGRDVLSGHVALAPQT